VQPAGRGASEAITEVEMEHLKVMNGARLSHPTANAVPASQLCYIFIDWGGCDAIDQCGFDFGACPGNDVCLIDY
jgi:hypothetical protein